MKGAEQQVQQQQQQPEAIPEAVEEEKVEIYDVRTLENDPFGFKIYRYEGEDIFTLIQNDNIIMDH